jgi:radical SAM-linked protein
MDACSVANRQITAAVFFKMGGLLRFLSHQETTRMLRRAIARAGINLKFSEGFNPHPKMSLPLPRSVAMASDCELMLVAVEAFDDGKEPTAEDIANMLSAQMPSGASIYDVKLYYGKVRFEAAAATYFLPLEVSSKSLKTRLLETEKAFEAGSPKMVERVSYKTGKGRQVNLAEFVQAMTFVDEGVLLKIKFIGGTTLKLDEMPVFLGVEQKSLTGAIIRKEIKWEIKT